MSLLADKIRSKFKFQISASKRGPVFPRNIGWAVGLAGTYVKFKRVGLTNNARDVNVSRRFLRNAMLVAIMLGFATIYNIYGGVFGGDVYAGSLTVTVSDDSANLNLVAAEGGVAYGESDTASFSISTTSSGGYTATITGGNSTGRLTGTDSNNYFSSISSATASPSSFSNGTWGFKPSTYNSSSNTSYQPVVTSSDVATLDVTDSAMTGNYTLAVAAKTDTDTAPDTYSYNFVVAATTNAVDYTVAYVDATANMPTPTVESTTSGNTITLDSKTPTKSGYVFAGWCSTEVTTLGSTTCSGTTYQPGGTYTVGSTTNITLYAMWEVVKPLSEMTRMDEMTTAGCEATATGASNNLIDDRGTSGSQSYTVVKLNDGKCWMTQNLRLTYNDTDTLEVSDGAGGTTSWKPERATNASWSDQNYYPYSYYGNNTTYGAYYNWTAAIASNDSRSYTTRGQVINTSICPKGWKLPQNASGAGSFYTLYNTSPYTSASAMLASPLNFQLAGSYYSGSLLDAGSRGTYWSSTVYGSPSAYTMYLRSSSVNPQDYFDRYYGRSVRCVSI